MQKMAKMLMEDELDGCLRRVRTGMFFRKKTVAELFNCSLWKQQLDYDSDDNRGEKPPKMHFRTPKDAIEFDVEDLSD